MRNDIIEHILKIAMGSYYKGFNCGDDFAQGKINGERARQEAEVWRAKMLMEIKSSLAVDESNRILPYEK